MLTGSLKVTPLAALSRFSNLKQEIIRMNKLNEKFSSSISPVQAGSWGARENYNCQHAWQQQGGNSILPPKKLEKIKATRLLQPFRQRAIQGKQVFQRQSRSASPSWPLLFPTPLRSSRRKRRRWFSFMRVLSSECFVVLHDHSTWLFHVLLISRS